MNGAALTLQQRIAVRTRVRAAFSFRNQVFRDVDAVVLECEGPPTGPYRVRLEFRDVSRDVDRRLSAAIARATTRKSLEPSSARA